MHQAKKLLSASLPLVLPIVCTALIHHYFFKTFGANNLTLGIYSRDIYIPLGLGAIFSLYHMIGNGVVLRFRLLYFIGTMVLLVGMIALLKNYLGMMLKFPHSTLIGTLLSSCFFILVLSFLTTLKFSDLLAYIRKRNSAALYTLVALGSLLNYPVILNFFWREASYLTAKSVYYVYRLFGVPLHFQLTPVSFNLSGGGFAIKIIMGCSGLEGVFFFVFGFSLLQCLEKRDFDWKVVGAYGVGSVFLFFLNTVRISTFYLLGIHLEKIFEFRKVKGIIEASFHNHLGWILYLLGIIIFVRVYRRVEKGFSTGVDAKTA